MWGVEPWDNDQAADWFAALMETSELPRIVRNTLARHEEENSNGELMHVMRAAIYVMVKFCRVYVWPINTLDADLSLAIQVTEDLLKKEYFLDQPKIETSLKNDLIELKGRQL